MTQPMDDATIRKYAKHVWQWVDDTTTITRVKSYSDEYNVPIVYRTIAEMDAIPTNEPVAYRRIPAKEARFQLYRFQLLDGSDLMLQLAIARDISTVFVKEQA